MAAFESSLKSLLQGVSQQIPRERLDGQVGAQSNMLSDAVTGLRRRPGSLVRYSGAHAGAVSGKVVGWDTDIGGSLLKLLLNTTTGVLTILDASYTVVGSLTSTYLQAADRKNIRTTTVGERMIIANLEKQPALGAANTAINTAQAGFFYVVAGAFSKAYTITGVFNGVTKTATYTTPNGSGAGDAALSTPEYITSQLHTQLNTPAIAGLAASAVSGPYAFFRMTSTDMRFTTSMSESYLVTSGNGYLRSSAALPARLPSIADTYVVATTSSRSPVYYQYNDNKQSWLESGAFGTPSTLTNMPIIIRRKVTLDGWEFDPTPYEGQLAGDTTNNPAPPFITRGITGMGSFQGRLVLLSGPTASLSGSGRPERWFRSTLVELIDSDPIQVGASANSSAAYQYAVPFQKDLILCSEKYQALIPSGNTALTPKNATVVITSSFESDMTSGPVNLGRTLMYATPRSADFFGVLEMVPSQYTDSQYISQDVTAHIPKYMPGRCSWSVSSSTSNLVLFGCTGDENSCVVHEYMWGDDGKVQQAWHKWTFPYAISDAFFSGSLITFVFVQNGVVVLATVDPRAGALTASAATRPFLDLYYAGTVTGGQFTLDATLRTFDPALAGKTKLSNAEGDLAGEQVGASYVAATDAYITTIGDGFPSGPVYAGVPYTSSVTPSTPQIKDSNGVVISSNKLTIKHFMVGTKNSGEFEASISDGINGLGGTYTHSPLFWSSPELALGYARRAAESTVVIPARTNAATTTLVLSASGTTELNIISLEYMGRYSQKLTRR